MTLRVYNSLGREKVDFVPRVDGEVSMYVCGPTVYDNAHLGHGRSAVAFDVVRRYLVYKGYKMKYVSNYTDIDDKMIKRAAEEGITVPELAEKIIPEYASDYGALQVLTPDVQPLATEYVAEMIEMVGMLIEKGIAYVIDGDGVYYDVSKFEEYGKLSGNKLEDLETGKRIAVAEGKKNDQDFVLWKFKKEGEPSWEAEFGDGRPGWHIECSAMTYKCLGKGFDIHGGGLDLTFPHHECEIAQTEGCFGEDTFAKYWMHNGFITIDDVKMSKSLGNFFTLKEIFEKYDPLVVRFMFLQTHYRNPVNFSDVLLDQAAAGLKRLRGVKESLLDIDSKFGDSIGEFKVFVERFEEAMDNDFDTSGALGVVFDFVKEVNRKIEAGGCDTGAALSALKKFDEVLAVIFSDMNDMDDDFTAKVDQLLTARDAARNDKDYGRADAIRDELLGMGVEILDSADGTKWRKL